MATLAQLKDARNTGLNLAKATQDFAQVDILSVNKDAPDVVAGIVAAADAVIVAARAIGGIGEGAATSAIVNDGDDIILKSGGGTYSVVATVADRAVTEVALPATDAIVRSGLHAVAATGTGTKVTFTVAAGKITAITLSA